MWKWVLPLVLMAAAPAYSDEGPRYRHYRHHHHVYLPAERHVVEVVRPPWSGRFIINGARFTAKTHVCNHWAAGDRIRLIAGDWNARCVDAVFYNMSRRSVCDVWCSGW